MGGEWNFDWNWQQKLPGSRRREGARRAAKVKRAYCLERQLSSEFQGSYEG